MQIRVGARTPASRWGGERLLRSIADVLDIDIVIPDHTTLSCRGSGFAILPKAIGREEPLHLLVDSTGLKICGEGEWLDQKRGIRWPRRWRKLHLGVDPAHTKLSPWKRRRMMSVMSPNYRVCLIRSMLTCRH